MLRDLSGDRRADAGQRHCLSRGRRRRFRLHHRVEWQRDGRDCQQRSRNNRRRMRERLEHPCGRALRGYHDKDCQLRLVHDADAVHSSCHHSTAGGDGIGPDQQDIGFRSRTPRNEERPAIAIKALAAGRRRNNGSLGEKGVAAIEFALIAPVMFLWLLGMVQFGLTVGNYVMLTNAASVGAMQFAISRSDTTPYTDTVSAIKTAAPALTPASLTITLSVNGTACATDSACSTALTAAAPSSGGSLQPAAVTVAYPCGSQLTWYNFWTSTCQLTSTMTEGVQ